MQTLTMLEYPIHDKYPAIYRDVLGEEQTIIHNDGQLLRMTVRHVEFIGGMPNGFMPVEDTDPTLLPLFTFQRGALCNCEIEYDAPVRLINRDHHSDVILHTKLVLGLPAERGWLDRESLLLSLFVDGRKYEGTGTSGWFEDELLEIQSQLPDSVSFKACIACAFSDYSPYGHNMFGNMICFRKNKAEYRQVKTKMELLGISLLNTELVQETYLCPEFECRTPGTGYRG